MSNTIVVIMFLLLFYGSGYSYRSAYMVMLTGAIAMDMIRILWAWSKND